MITIEKFQIKFILFRKTHLHYLKTLQVAYVEQFNKVLEMEEERKKEVKKKQEMNSFLRTGSQDVEKLAKSGKINFDDIMLSSRVCFCFYFLFQNIARYNQVFHKL
jgi:hypothetical protein